MTKNSRPFRIVLLGIGHTNVHILQQWRRQPIVHAELVCISDFPFATYSGMLPGVLSGQYDHQDMEINLSALCDLAGVELSISRVQHVDTDNRQVTFFDRPPLNYDWLSIGVGSQPSTRSVEIAESAQVVLTKPMQTFVARLQHALAGTDERSTKTRHISIVGGGVAGIEIASCLRQRLKRDFGNQPFKIRIITADRIGSGLSPKSQRRVATELAAAGIQTADHQQVTLVSEADITTADGTVFPTDVTIWAGAAEATELLRRINLPRDPNGFLTTQPTLQSTGDDRVFVVGDCGSIKQCPSPKAGVYAVRQAPVLWRNLNRSISSGKLVKFKPQRNFLKLLNLGDGRALAEYHGFTFLGRWCWRLKDHIDRGFVGKYQTEGEGPNAKNRS